MKSDYQEFGAIILEPSIFTKNQFNFEKGLLGKLSQFSNSKIKFLLPDLVKNEIQHCLHKALIEPKKSVEKALRDADAYLFFDGSKLNTAKSLLMNSNEIEDLVEWRIQQFIRRTDALELDCGKYASTCNLVDLFINSKPPFSLNTAKSSDFPDAIILLAVEAWAKKNHVKILAVADALEWQKYCDISDYITYTDSLSNALDILHKEIAPFTLISNLEKAYKNNELSDFNEKIQDSLEYYFANFSPDIEANSYLFWESENLECALDNVEFFQPNFKIIDHSENYIVIKADASITIEAKGDFSFSQYDSQDKDYVPIGCNTIYVEEIFFSELLITISGDLNGEISDLHIDNTEVIQPMNTINFRDIEPCFGEDEDELNW